MKTLKFTVLHVLLFAQVASVALGAESRAVDVLETIGDDNTPVTSRIVNGVTVDISTASETMTARTYDGGLTAFVGPGDSPNTPLNPENVSGSRFVSTSGPPSGYFQNVQPITFNFSSPAQTFGLTTLGLMTTNIGPTETVTLQAFNASGGVVGQVTRVGPQGAEGVDLDWLIHSSGQDIISATLSGAIVTGGGYGIDDLVVGRPTGNLAVWGNDEYSQVGNTPTSGDFKAVAAGSHHNLALETDGAIVAWGADGWGQVSSTPSGNEFVAVTAGHSHNLALRVDGSIAAWGTDARGQVSNAPGTDQFAALAAGVGHSVALSSDGSLVSWGSDDYGLVTDTPSGTDFVAIDATLWHTVAVKENGTIISWGVDNGSAKDHGQVTDTPTGSDFVAIAAGGYHNLALHSDGSLVSWGRDLEGQVSDTPVGTDFVAIAAGYFHSLALKSDGTIVAWGLDEWGEIMHAPTGAEFTAIAAGAYHSIALVPPTLTWQGGSADWAAGNWHDGITPYNWPETGAHMIVDADTGDSDVTVSTDFDFAHSLAIGQNHAARVGVHSDVTLYVDTEVTVGPHGTLDVAGSGRVEVGGVITIQGRLSGDGTVSGTHVAITGPNASIAPGASIGTINIDGDCTLRESSCSCHFPRCLVDVELPLVKYKTNSCEKEGLSTTDFQHFQKPFSPFKNPLTREAHWDYAMSYGRMVSSTVRICHPDRFRHRLPGRKYLGSE